MTGIGGLGAAVATGGAAAAGVAGASVARHGGAIVAKALDGGNCGGGEEDGGGGSGGGGEGMSGKLIAGIGIAALIGMIALSKTPEKPKAKLDDKNTEIKTQSSEIKEPTKTETTVKASATA